jgi:hypothetical protein
MRRPRPTRKYQLDSEFLVTKDDLGSTQKRNKCAPLTGAQITRVLLKALVVALARDIHSSCPLRFHTKGTATVPYLPTNRLRINDHPLHSLAEISSSHGQRVGDYHSSLQYVTSCLTSWPTHSRKRY